MKKILAENADNVNGEMYMLRVEEGIRYRCKGIRNVLLEALAKTTQDE